MPNKGGGGVLAFIKVNDHQYFEIFNEKDRGEGQLNHIWFYTDNADPMRDYLTSKGAPAPDKVGRGQTRNKNFNIKDSGGHIVEIVGYQRDSWTAREAGKFLPSTCISTHIMHVGVLVGDLDKAMAFYQDILGFKEFWHGSGSSNMLSWVNMRVPEGEDYLEFML